MFKHWRAKICLLDFLKRTLAFFCTTLVSYGDIFHLCSENNSWVKLAKSEMNAPCQLMRPKKYLSSVEVLDTGAFLILFKCFSPKFQPYCSSFKPKKVISFLHISISDNFNVTCFMNQYAQLCFHMNMLVYRHSKLSIQWNSIPSHGCSGLTEAFEWLSLNPLALHNVEIVLLRCCKRSVGSNTRPQR